MCDISVSSSEFNRGKCLKSSKSFSKNELVFSETPLFLCAKKSNDLALYTPVWVLTFELIASNKHHLVKQDLAVLPNTQLQWEVKDELAVNYISQTLNIDKNNVKTLYNRIVSCNLTIYDRQTKRTLFAIYNLLSYINHSCDPNCDISIDFNKKLIARRQIQPGEELTISYSTGIALLNSMPDRFNPETKNVKSRSLAISQILGFNCLCSICKQS